MEEYIIGILERVRGYMQQKKELQLKISFLDKEVKRQYDLIDDVLDAHQKTV